MRERADDRLREDVGLMFVIYCDEHALTVAESDDLSQLLQQEIDYQADERHANG